jgi:hypothetical protein
MVVENSARPEQQPNRPFQRTGPSVGKGSAFPGGSCQIAFLTVHHRFSPVPSSQVFLGSASSREKESSTGDEQ